MNTITACVYTCSVNPWCLVTSGICCCHDVGFAKVVDPSIQAPLRLRRMIKDRPTSIALFHAKLVQQQQQTLISSMIA